MALQLFRKSTEVSPADHIHLEWKWLSMVHIDPGAGGIVYVQPKHGMVPSKLHCRFWKKNSIFSFHKSLFKKALLSHFLGQQRGYPRTASHVWPPPRLSQGPTFLEQFQDFKGTSHGPSQYKPCVPSTNKKKKSWWTNKQNAKYKKNDSHNSGNIRKIG